MLKNDTWIREAALNGMITPYQGSSVKQTESNKHPVLSYGQSSYGYDLRLSTQDFKLFRYIPGTIVDPKRFDPINLVDAILQEDENDRYFILPGHSYGLGVTVETLNLPSDIFGLCVGKSTIARCGIHLAMTPVEPGWKGNLTIELANDSPADVRLYAGEGIAQLIFFQGNPCQIDYAQRKGKYQGQGEQVTIAKC